MKYCIDCVYYIGSEYFPNYVPDCKATGDILAQTKTNKNKDCPYYKRKWYKIWIKET